jgi:biopolymer transport protein ExbD
MEVTPFQLEAKPPTSSIRVEIDAAGDRYLVAKRPLSGHELTESLSVALKDDPGVAVVLLAPEGLPFSRIREAMRTVRDAGPLSIRLGTEGDRP